MSTGGFSFASTTTQSSGGLGGTGGFSFGNTTKPVGTATPFAAGSFGGTSATTTSSAAGTVGFGGAAAASTAAPLLNAVKPLVASTTATLTLGGLGSTTTTGFGTAASGTTLGGLAAKPIQPLLGDANSSSTGLSSFAAKPTLSLGGASTAATSTSGFSLLGGTAAAGASGGLSGALGGGLGGATTASASLGLGGVDPKDSAAGNTAAGTAGKPRDSKIAKESQVPAPICQTVQEFKKYVKNQKSVYESIARMSSKNLYRVQEEVVSLKQLLALVSNGLQRNAVAINNLKLQSAQELKFAEIAQRTKDTPPGLQYENTAPTEYFQKMMVDFEQRMVTCRQQIEQTETYLASMNQESVLTPHELSALMSKLHSSFISLAAQLQVVHEAVKVQKEHYLNYRKVFHGDTADIFARRRKAEQKTGSSVVFPTVGPTPFTGMSNAAAIAMAAAVNRTPQQQQPSGTAVPTGLTMLGQPTGIATGGFGTVNPGVGATAGTGGLFGSKPTTGLGSSLGTASTGTSLFGSANTQTGGFGSLGTGTGFGTAANTSLGFGQQTTGFGQQNTSFTLQKPPLGNKRNKNA